MVWDEAPICPVCQRRNKPGDTECAFCGEVLQHPLTLLKPERPSECSEQEYLESLLSQYYDSLILYVVGQKQPLVLRNITKVILGRQPDPMATSVVDLVDYGAYTLGVSRQHARILTSNTGYLIEDLNSANGTFINEKRLSEHETHALRNGDFLRLGQMLFFVYFNAGKHPEQLGENHFTLIINPLVEEMPAVPGLTVNRLNKYLIPYLNALVELQHQIDEKRERPAVDVSVISINYNENERVIRVVIRGAADSLYILRHIITEWRRQQAAALLQQRRIEKAQEQAITTLMVSDGDDPTLDADALSGQVHEIIHNFQKHLLIHVLSYIAPEMQQSTPSGFAEQVLPFLRVLSFSPLEMVTE
ncbi:MAG: FHA domain-containing protein [Anaerolineae bacterium]|nr:FHA domain-containing protein [Anaerolineae bacterium]